MICHSKRFIFIDICRCAGTSISATLAQRYECIGKHHSINNITGKYWFCTTLTQYEIDNYFKFVFVRNPYDRLLSLYRWRVTSKYRIYPFNEFVIKVKNKHWNEYKGHRFIPMYDWITDEFGKARIDFIGKYENLQKDFNKICDIMRIVKMPLLNLSCGVNKFNRCYRRYYDAESKAIVTQLYKKDLDYFGYGF